LRNQEVGEMAFEPFEVSTEEHPGIVVARLCGELDLSGQQYFQEEVRPLMAKASGGTLVIDLRGLTFIDSTGLRLLLEIDAESRNDGFGLSIIKGNSQVHRAFRLTGLDEVLPMTTESPEVTSTVGCE
jgi:anti-anti-sigma factor